MYLTAKLPAADKQIYFGLIVWILTLCLFSPLTSQAAGIPLKMLKTETGQEPQIPKGLSPDEVDAYLAGLSDVQARQVLARKLKQEAGDSRPGTEGDAAEGDTPESIFHELADGTAMVADRIGSFLSSDKSGSLKRGAILRRLSDGKGIGQSVADGIHRVCNNCLWPSRRATVSAVDGWASKTDPDHRGLGQTSTLGRFFSRLLLDALGVGVYILTTFILFIIIFRQEEAGYWIVAEFLIVSYYFLGDPICSQSDHVTGFSAIKVIAAARSGMRSFFIAG